MTVSHSSTTNTFEQLKSERLSRATRPFLARGAKVARCDRCQLQPSHCICPSRKGIESRIDFVLLLHPNEILKPSNTGRLIADCFPEQTHALEWNRCEPCERAKSILSDQQRLSIILFPASEVATEKRSGEHWPDPTIHALMNQRHDETVDAGNVETNNLFHRRLTVWLLDGTWRQASKMFRQSEWLAGLPSMAFTPEAKADYQLRQAAEAAQLSTAEAANLVLKRWQLEREDQHLSQYFSLFNQRYQEMRANRLPQAIKEIDRAIKASDK